VSDARSKRPWTGSKKEIARLEQRQKDLTAELENPATYHKKSGRAVR